MTETEHASERNIERGQERSSRKSEERYPHREEEKKSRHLPLLAHSCCISPLKPHKRAPNNPQPTDMILKVKSNKIQVLNLRCRRRRLRIRRNTH